MSTRCNICLEEQCKKTKGLTPFSCNCESCKAASDCNKHLHPTIRITNKCTQICSHCCYSSSPNATEMMSIQTSQTIAEFLKNNNIQGCQIMGGEFFCNPDFVEIIETISSAVKRYRLVTNGDWVANPNKVIDLLKSTKNVTVGISKDVYHTNSYVDAAINILESEEISFRVASEDEGTNDANVPIGRSMYDYSFYSSFGSFCKNPERAYSFMIDEEGDIFKCPFGIFKYTNVKRFEDGGFDECFKHIHKVFYDTFIPSCKQCIEMSFRESFRNSWQENVVSQYL